MEKIPQSPSYQFIESLRNFKPTPQTPIFIHDDQVYVLLAVPDLPPELSSARHIAICPLNYQGRPGKERNGSSGSVMLKHIFEEMYAKRRELRHGEYFTETSYNEE